MSHTTLRLRFFIALLVLFGAPAALAESAAPNVVLIISDYMGYRDIEPYGAEDVRTPSLARLAAEGVTMTEFYAAAPVCGPARAALYTGRYPAKIGFEQNIRGESSGLSSQLPTLPRWLKDAGYKTALFGKWHLGRSPEFTPAAHGFDEFIGHHAWTIGYYHHKDANGNAGLYDGDSVIHREGTYLTDLLTSETVQFIERNQQQPFFVTLAYNAALPPYQPPGLPEENWNDGWDVNKAARSDYVQMVEQMDRGIGRILDTLDDLDLSDNTLVIYTYDHGGRHLVNSAPFFHGFSNLWEGGIRTPAILRLPDILPSNERSPLQGIAMDLTATILDVAGIDETLDGVSLIPLLDGSTPLADRTFFWRANLYEFGQQHAVRSGRWKYVEHGNTQFLFDLTEDLGERHNLFYERTDVVNQLRSELSAWRAEL